MKLGRLPAVFPGAIRDLTYYSAGDLPAPATRIDVPTVTDWQMLGNDRYGDCGVAGLEHGFMADAAVTHEQEGEASDQQAIDFYLQYTGGQDTGVVLSAYLQYVRQHGYYGHSVKAYAPVNVHDVPTLQTAVTLYDFAYTGIIVTEGMQQAFAAGEPWATSDLESQVLGGHCVPIVGYSDEFLYVVTWGKVQPVTYSAWHQMAEEAWCVLTGELVARHGDGRGISLEALEADLAKLDG